MKDQQKASKWKSKAFALLCEPLFIMFSFVTSIFKDRIVEVTILESAIAAVHYFTVGEVSDVSETKANWSSVCHFVQVALVEQVKVEIDVIGAGKSRKPANEIFGHSPIGERSFSSATIRVRYRMLWDNVDQIVRTAKAESNHVTDMVDTLLMIQLRHSILISVGMSTS